MRTVFCLMIVAIMLNISGTGEYVLAGDDLSLGRLLFIGDSITEGKASRPDGDGNWSWRYAFWKKLVDLGVSYQFVGTRTNNAYGKTSTYPVYKGCKFTNRHEAIWGTTALERGNSAPTYLGKILATGGAPDTAIIFLGGNDVPIDLSVSAETVRDRVKTIIDYCQGDLGNSGNAAIRILIISVLPRFTGGFLDIPDVRNTRFEEINSLLKTLASAETTSSSKVSFLDLVPEFNSSPELLYDGTHPNGDGENLIGKAVFDVFFPPPGMATNPSPANDATNVAWDVILSWTPGSSTISHNVYMNTNSVVTLLTNQTDAIYNIGKLDAYTTYFWRIDEINEYGTTTGKLWRFTTKPPPNTTNLVPYSESFEGYDIGTQLGWSNGWYAATLGAARVTSNTIINAALNNYAINAEYPINTNHTRYLTLTNDVANRLDTPTNSIVSVDMMVCVTYCYGEPIAYSNLQASLQFNDDGHPVLWHRDISGGSNCWTTFPQITVTTGDWARVTLTLDYETLDMINNIHYYKAQVNGELLTNSFGFTSNDGTGKPGGSWFAMAGIAPTNRFSSVVFFTETGQVDDLVISTKK